MNANDVSSFAQALDIITKKAGATITTYGPEAFSIAVQYEHSIGMFTWIPSVIICILLVLSTFYFFRATRKAYAVDPLRPNDFSANTFFYGVLTVISFAICVLTLICAVTDVPTLLQVFEPKFAVINAAVAVVTGSH